MAVDPTTSEDVVAADAADVSGAATTNVLAAYISVLDAATSEDVVAADTAGVSVAATTNALGAYIHGVDAATSEDVVAADTADVSGAATTNALGAYIHGVDAATSEDVVDADVARTVAVYSCVAAVNAERVADALGMFVPDGAVGCDVTYGQGNFWNASSLGRVTVLATDLQMVMGVMVLGRPLDDVGPYLGADVDGGIDLRALPYHDGCLDFAVLDPPYMGGFFRKNPTQTSHESDFAERYGHHAGGGVDGLYGMAAVQRLYTLGVVEAARVLKPKTGVLLVKCMDSVENHRKHFVTDHVTKAAVDAGFRKVDALLVLRRDNPHLQRQVRGPAGRQWHARQNHSALLVFQRC